MFSSNIFDFDRILKNKRVHICIRIQSGKIWWIKSYENLTKLMAPYLGVSSPFWENWAWSTEKEAQSLKLSEVHDSAVRLLFKFREHEFFCESGPFSYTLDFYSFFVKSNQTAGSCTSVNFETLWTVCPFFRATGTFI